MVNTPFLTTDAAGLVLPEFVGPILVEPLAMTSVAMRVSSNVSTPSPQYRIPLVTADPVSHWVSEGSALTEENPSIDELVVTPSKLTALVQVSRELVADSINNESATAVIGDGIVRSIARQLDSAYFGNTVANGPSGLQSLSGVQTVNVGGVYENFDWAVEAESKLNRVGSTATAFVMNANTLEALATIKRFAPTTDVVSNESLLQVGDPTSKTKYRINGTECIWVPPLTPLGDEVIADGVIWALHDVRSFVVMRQDVELITSPWPGFANDVLTVRAIMRFGFAWPYAKAVVKIIGTLPTLPGS